MKKNLLIWLLAMMISVSSYADQVITQATTVTSGIIVSGTIKHAVLKNAASAVVDTNKRFPAETVLSGGTISNVNLTSGIVNSGNIKDGKYAVTAGNATIDVVRNANLISAGLVGVNVSGMIKAETGEALSNPVSVDLDNVEIVNAEVHSMVVPAQSVGAITGTDSVNAPTYKDFFTQGAWGVGASWIWNVSPVISSASIVNNNMVRADTIQQSQPELLLTRHWYLTAENPNLPGSQKCKNWHLGGGTDNNTCVGFFVAFGVGNSNTAGQLVDMLGGGIMWGFGQTQQTINGKTYENVQLRQHNIGIGYGRRFGVKQLGDGFSNNAPPPAGETQVRYKNVDIPVWFLMYSYTLPAL